MNPGYELNQNSLNTVKQYIAYIGFCRDQKKYSLNQDFIVLRNNNSCAA
jgi:hypothetical protein